ncbi:MAG: hypothetical protein KJO26_03220 [Deltaproteobacteria bacterium]|nr:hypothetical protein [Deltaproteobacteria bacterium]
MICNISYNDRELKEKVREAVGPPFSWKERYRMGGNGSPRFVITEASKPIADLLERDNRINYCNIELRGNGIIVGFRAILETYGWIIPWQKLTLFKSDNHYTIYAGEDHIRIDNSRNAKNNGKFFNKLISLKSKKVSETSLHYWH